MACPEIPALIRGPRLSLRLLTENDVTDTYLQWLCDPEVTYFLETQGEQTLERLRSYVCTLRQNDAVHFFGIFLAAEGTHIGNIKLGPIHPKHQRGDVGIIIGAKEHWGKGLASEAISLLAGYAFDKLKVHKLTAGVYAPNKASIQAFLKAGFIQEGLLKSHGLLGEHHTDVVCLGCVNLGSTGQTRR